MVKAIALHGKPKLQSHERSLELDWTTTRVNGKALTKYRADVTAL